MKIFDRYYKKYDAWYDKNEFAYLSELKAIRKVLPKKGKGLEIGVGTGRFAQALGIGSGVDPSKNMIEIAKKRGVNVKLGYGERLPFKNTAFDYVAVIITICFTKNPEKVLKEAYRVLKTKGKIIIGIVDKDSFLGKFYQKKKSAFYKEAVFFSVKEIVYLLGSTGFSKFSYYQTLYDFPDEIKSVQKPQKGFGKGGFVVISGEKTISGRKKYGFDYR
ncbi:MAG: SAM-dependent methyltransferase [Candidatus Omnitrophota bacterium]|nr:MAG: SAM-dependent methyltransferase [Candidatus Omnitrophota bacterium]